ncbi:MAG: hypothetical protein ACI37T_03895 [Candidatus Gastranaerophilaceae bacterium]
MNRADYIKMINSGMECDKKCPVHNLYTHNTCICCKAFKNSPYHKDYLKGKTDEEIAQEVEDIVEEEIIDEK